MKSIWKYTLPITDNSIVSMPIGAKVISVQNQKNDVRLWVIVNPDTEPKEYENRHFKILGTGHVHEEIQDHFIGTVQIGSLVWHVFERKNDEH